jgi:hypothetical protein
MRLNTNAHGRARVSLAPRVYGVGDSDATVAEQYFPSGSLEEQMNFQSAAMDSSESCASYAFITRLAFCPNHRPLRD